MSPLLQKRRPSQSPDPPTSSNQRTPNRSPQSWFRPANNRSLSNLARTQHPHRALGFSSIRELARSSSRQTLRTLPATTHQQPYSHGCSPPKDGRLRQQLVAQDTSRVPPDLDLHESRGSSVDSLPIDKSGISNDSTYATTPSPARHRAFQLLESNSPVERNSMGNKASTVLRKPVPVEGKQSPASSTTDPEKALGPSPQQISTGSQLSKTFSARGSSIIVNVPRRRSSLTVLHLDSSHFETPDPQHRDLQHRASTLTEPRRRPSILAETTRPITTIVTSTSGTTPTIQVQKRETLSPPFLSPPLLSPPLSTSQHSSASSQAPSFNSRNSVVPAFIHLPKTFPDGPIPVPAPPLTITHHKCFQSHRRILLSRNKVNPVPCMTCGDMKGQVRWKCIWCALRICEPCMAEFDAKHRNLDKFLAWLEERKEGRKEGGGKYEAQELDSGGEQIKIKKENLPNRRELPNSGTKAMAKLLLTPQ